MNIIDFLDNASKAYYEGEPIISDETFDALAKQYNYNRVGYKTDGVPHYFQMYSLDKVYPTDKNPLDMYEVVETPKLDGNAVSLLYINGTFTLGLTRGNGITGIDITDKLATLVPNNIEMQGAVQITGEVIAPKTIPNSRNYTAGALNLKDFNEFKTRELYFIAYGIEGIEINTYSAALILLYKLGFETVKSVDADKFPQDGKVQRVDSMKIFNELGYTAKHPRGAVALKENAEGIPTTLREVIWQTGKTGKVTPVAVFDEVIIDDAKVTRASLGSLALLEALDLDIGDTVLVIRSGGIIPQIVGVEKLT